MLVIAIQEHTSKENGKQIISNSHPSIYERMAPLIYGLQSYIDDDFSDIVTKAQKVLQEFPELNEGSINVIPQTALWEKIKPILTTAKHNPFWPSFAISLMIMFKIKDIKDVPRIVGIKNFCLSNLELLKEPKGS